MPTDAEAASICIALRLRILAPSDIPALQTRTRAVPPLTIIPRGKRYVCHMLSPKLHAVLA